MKETLICLAITLMPQLFFSQDSESTHYGILGAKNYTTGMHLPGNKTQSVDYHFLEMLSGDKYRLFRFSKKEMPLQFYLGYFEFDSTKVGKIVAVEGDIQNGDIFPQKRLKKLS